MALEILRINRHRLCGPAGRDTDADGALFFNCPCGPLHRRFRSRGCLRVSARGLRGDRGRGGFCRGKLGQSHVVQVQYRPQRRQPRKRLFVAEPLLERSRLAVFLPELLHGLHGTPVGVLHDHTPAPVGYELAKLLGDLGPGVLRILRAAHGDRASVPGAAFEMGDLPPERPAARRLVADGGNNALPGGQVPGGPDRTWRTRLSRQEIEFDKIPVGLGGNGAVRSELLADGRGGPRDELGLLLFRVGRAARVVAQEVVPLLAQRQEVPGRFFCRRRLDANFLRNGSSAERVSVEETVAQDFPGGKTCKLVDFDYGDGVGGVRTVEGHIHALEEIPQAVRDELLDLLARALPGECRRRRILLQPVDGRPVEAFSHKRVVVVEARDDHDRRRDLVGERGQSAHDPRHALLRLVEIEHVFDLVNAHDQRRLLSRPHQLAEVGDNAQRFVVRWPRGYTGDGGAVELGERVAAQVLQDAVVDDGRLALQVEKRPERVCVDVLEPWLAYELLGETEYLLRKRLSFEAVFRDGGS